QFSWVAARRTSRWQPVRASSVGGIVRPSSLAVFMLMPSSIFVINCTGRSAGFPPLAGVDPDLAERLRKSRPIAHKATRRRVCEAWVNRGHRIAGCQCDKLIMLRATEEHCFAANQERGEGQAEHDQAPAESQAGA